MFTAQLPKEVFENVQRFPAGNANEQLKARLLKLIFLINKLPADAAMDIGLKATDDVMADLLVTDLSAGSTDLRKQLPNCWKRCKTRIASSWRSLAATGRNTDCKRGNRSAWYDEYRAQEAELKAGGTGQRTKAG